MMIWHLRATRLMAPCAPLLVGITTLALTACGAPGVATGSRLLAAPGQPLGQYRGHAAINRDLRETVVDSRDSYAFNFVSFASPDGLDTVSTQALQPLLGEWSRDGLNGSLPSVFRNGIPTAVSAFLYDRIMGRLGTVFSGACAAPTFALGAFQYRFSEDFMLATKALCAGERNLRLASKGLWQLVVGYDFDPYFEALVDWMERVPGIDQMTPSEHLEVVMRTILLHPVFLLSY